MANENITNNSAPLLGQHYEPSIRDYFQIFQRRKGLVAIIFVTVLFVNAFLTWMQTPTYQTQATLRVEEYQSLQGLLLEAFVSRPTDVIATEMQILQSYPILRKVAHNIGLIRKNVSEDEARDIVERLQSQIVVDRLSDVNIIKVTVQSSSPKDAVRIARTLIDVYIEENLNRNKHQVTRTREFIENQLHGVSEKLEQAENRLKAFREEEGIHSLNEELSQTLSQLAEAQTDYEKLKLQKQEQLIRLSILKGSGVPSYDIGIHLLPGMKSGKQNDGTSGKMHDENIPISPQAAEDTVVAQLKLKLYNLDTELLEQLSQYKPNYPSVVRLRKEIDSVKQQLEKEVSRVKTGQEQHLDVLTKSETSLQSTISNYEQQLSHLSGKQLQQAQLMRDVTVNEELYKMLRMELEKARINESSRVQNVSMVSPAVKPRHPIKPNRVLNMVIGLILGIILSLTATLLMESMDTSIGTIEDIERFLSLPVIGVISFLKEKAKSKKTKSMLLEGYDRTSPYVESFRILHANLRLAGLSSPKNVLLLTSTTAGEGKTTIAVNLALAMAQAGDKVLLVEGDMRRPSFHRALGIAKEPGLYEVVLKNLGWEKAVKTISDLLAGESDLEALVKIPGIENLHIITAGAMPPSTIELLASAKLKELISLWKTQFDVVLIDSPSLLPVADSMLLGGLVDYILLAYLAGRTPINALRRTKMHLLLIGTPCIGVVVNHLRPTVEIDYPYQYRYEEKKK